MAAVLLLSNISTTVGAEQRELEWLSGRASVIDGDTLKIGQIPIRIHGIDAPEKNQVCIKENISWKCGVEATKLMRSLVMGSEVSCEKLDQDRYGRVVGRCFPVNTCRWNGSPRACSEECGRVDLLHLGNGEEENGSDTKRKSRIKIAS